MNKNLLMFFAFFGVMLFAFIAIFLVITGLEALGEYIKLRRYAYKRAHRFGGPPLAKCHCKDCVYGFKPYEDTDDIIKCSRGYNIHCEDAWFCKDAYPRVHDPDKNRKVVKV